MKKIQSLEKRKSRYGFLFVLPWFIGVLMFFIVPMIKSIWYSFCDVSLEAGGFSTVFVGLKQYKYIITEEPYYMDNLTSSLASYFTSLPIIIAVSLIIAIMLNTKFKGRIIFRMIYFLPAIIAGSMILDYLNGGTMSMESISTTAGSAYVVNSVDFVELLADLNLPDEISKLISQYIASVFNLIWNCGIPIILFISGLQSIPETLYEASKVEGANKWEEFWYITIPMLANVILLVVVYVSLDLFTTENNSVITQAYTFMRNNVIYDTTAAMLWLYFLIMGAILGAVLLVVNKFVFKKWQ